jgi:hypothetical protein
MRRGSYVHCESCGLYCWRPAGMGYLTECDECRAFATPPQQTRYVVDRRPASSRIEAQREEEESPAFDDAVRLVEDAPCPSCL